MDALEFVVRFARRVDGVRTFRFVAYPVAESLEKRSALPAAGWVHFTERALHHDNTGAHVWELAPQDVSVAALRGLIEGLEKRYALAMSSRVTLLDGSDAHIPMMDFRCPPSSDNLKAVEHMATSVGQPDGAFLNSTNSYHFYGFTLMSEREWVVFLGKCLLFGTLVDARYIGHRLIDGECRLRLSAFAEKHAPIVVGVCSP
ncbi:MAG: hypothetical protein JOZ24_04010 [Candidatus Eremiobacteraeota bacterium]|nr:hypothetical protein [Candidatus Eremiobacteraeota bacterium]